MKKEITFVFQSGRTSRLNENDETYSKEFFYSYHQFKAEYEKVHIVEFEDSSSVFNKILKYLSSIMRYLTTIPFYFEKIMYLKNLKIFIKSDVLIFTNQRVAFTSSLLIFVSKIFNKKLESSVFIMGLFINQSKNAVRIHLRELFTLVFLKQLNKIIFLGQGEYEYAKQKYPKFSKKFYFLPFSIDTNFWHSTQDVSINKNILFIGNDGKRDYEKVIEIANSLRDYSFTLISNNIDENKLTNKNISIYKGSWAENKISDLDIRTIYENSFISIIPLVNSNQPSGQSVALQSMAMGLPVLISKTKGFWDNNYFKNNENIIFNYENTVQSWNKLIENMYDNKSLHSDISRNGKLLVNKRYNLETFFSTLKSIVF